MLIFTRRIGESTIIGDGNNKTTVTLLAIKGGQVRIGFEASRNIPVYREEIYEKIQKQKTESVDNINVE